MKHPAPFVKWAGGKGQLLSQYESHLPDTFGRYVEPFAGGGAVFFHLHRQGRLAGKQVVLIDRLEELINAYRAVQGRVEELIAAYEGKGERDSRRYEGVAGRKVNVRGRDFLGEQVQEFERVQRIGADTRALRDEVAHNLATLKLLKQEQRRRAEESQKLKLFLKRLLSVDL